MHGGSLVAASDGANRGATFTVTLPVEFEQGASQEELHMSLAGFGIKPGVSGKTVLVIDDDADTLEAFALLFTEGGARVRTARSAAQARDVLAQGQVDAIFSDIGMPGEDGYQLMKSLRAAGNRTPAVAVSAFVQDEDRRCARAAGFNEHLAKPVDPALLLIAFARVTSADKPQSEH